MRIPDMRVVTDDNVKRLFSDNPDCVRIYKLDKKEQRLFMVGTARLHEQTYRQLMLYASTTDMYFVEYLYRGE